MNFIDTDLWRKRAPWEITGSATAAWTPDESKINDSFACISTVYERHFGERCGAHGCPLLLFSFIIFLCLIDRSLLKNELDSNGAKLSDKMTIKIMVSQRHHDDEMHYSFREWTPVLTNSTSLIWLQNPYLREPMQNTFYETCMRPTPGHKSQ